MNVGPGGFTLSGDSGHASDSREDSTEQHSEHDDFEQGEQRVTDQGEYRDFEEREAFDRDFEQGENFNRDFEQGENYEDDGSEHSDTSTVRYEGEEEQVVPEIVEYNEFAQSEGQEREVYEEVSRRFERVRSYTSKFRVKRGESGYCLRFGNSDRVHEFAPGTEVEIEIGDYGQNVQYHLSIEDEARWQGLRINYLVRGHLAGLEYRAKERERHGETEFVGQVIAKIYRSASE